MACRLDAWQLNVEQVLSNMEVAKQQGALFAALKSGSEAVAQMQEEVTVADVEALMQTSAEAQAAQQALQVCISLTVIMSVHASGHIKKCNWDDGTCSVFQHVNFTSDLLTWSKHKSAYTKSYSTIGIATGCAGWCTTRQYC